jgi:hypothetical protein
MNAEDFDVDMARCAVMLRCFADFMAARPGLPQLASLSVTWSHVARLWEVRCQLDGESVMGIARWALALEDPVESTRDGNDKYLGPYRQRAVSGTVHGHAVTVWAHELRNES